MSSWDKMSLTEKMDMLMSENEGLPEIVSVEQVKQLYIELRARAEETKRELERNRKRVEELEDESRADYEDC